MNCLKKIQFFVFAAISVDNADAAASRPIDPWLIYPWQNAKICFDPPLKKHARSVGGDTSRGKRWDIDHTFLNPDVPAFGNNLKSFFDANHAKERNPPQGQKVTISEPDVALSITAQFTRVSDWPKHSSYWTYTVYDQNEPMPGQGRGMFRASTWNNQARRNTAIVKLRDEEVWKTCTTVPAQVRSEYSVSIVSADADQSAAADAVLSSFTITFSKVSAEGAAVDAGTATDVPSEMTFQVKNNACEETLTEWIRKHQMPISLPIFIDMFKDRTTLSLTAMPTLPTGWETPEVGPGIFMNNRRSIYVAALRLCVLFKFFKLKGEGRHVRETLGEIGLSLGGK